MGLGHYDEERINKKLLEFNEIINVEKKKFEENSNKAGTQIGKAFVVFDRQSSNPLQFSLFLDKRKT